MVEIIIVFIVVAIVFASSGAKSKKWQAAGAQTGLRYSSGLFERDNLSGTLEGFDVRVFKTNKGHNDIQLVAEVRGVDPGFSLTAERGLASLISGDIETGDKSFDSALRITGDAEIALAVLSHRARGAAKALIQREGYVDRRRIRVPLDSLGQAQSRLESMLALAKLLSRPSSDDIPKLLANQALRDRSSAVRLRAFRQLLQSQHFRPSELFELAEELLGTRDPELGYEASRVLLSRPERHEGALKTMGKLASAQHIASEIRIAAVERLAESKYRSEAVPSLLKILGRPNDHSYVRIAALEGLIKAGEKDELLAFSPVNAHEAQQLADALGRFDAAQPRLLELLGHSSGRVRAAAATSLGEVGDIEAMAPLHEVAEGGFLKAGEARAASAAMEKIKARTGTSQRGEISMVSLSPLEGAVSQSDEEEGGEVSLTP
ncbi:MAG: HEAT repeat domain-containing protein [Acidobacteriota bacterium]